MSFYKELLVLEPYFKSIRKLKDYLSFDLEIPKTWKLPKKFVKEEQIVEFENTNLIFNIKNVIDFNRELEEKEKLFQNKVNELKNFFEKENLQNLQGLKFEINDIKLELENAEPEVEPSREDTGVVKK
jgi:hypothetical protein